MTSSARSKTLEIRVGPAADALDRFEAAWNRIGEGGKPVTLRVLTLETLPLLLKTLTPARWALVERLRETGPVTIYELAKRLERDYKNVHTDVSALAGLGLVERGDDGRVAVGWNRLRAELSLV